MADQPPPADPQGANDPATAEAQAAAKFPKVEMEKLHKAEMEKPPKLEQKEIKSEVKGEGKESLIKEHKPEKFEHKEKIEHKEFKNEGKVELKEAMIKEHKLEIKEKLEKVEHKEFKSEAKLEHKESLIKEHKPEKFEILEKDVPEVPPHGDPLGDPAIHQRLSQIESSIAELRHFIKPQDRPDLSQGALSNEPDVQPGS